MRGAADLVSVLKGISCVAECSFCSNRHAAAASFVDVYNSPRHSLAETIMSQDRSDGDRPSPVDRSILADLCGGDAAFERRILANFRRVTETDAPRLRDAVSSSDGVAVTRLSHSIKGASRTIGAHDLGNVCDLIEQASRSAVWPTVLENMPAFEREIGRVNDYLQSVLNEQAGSAPGRAKPL
jgi:HPt (histidine-containing phosphotransfer) domain-containing protein